MLRLFTLLLTVALFGLPVRAAERPNVLLILLDDNDYEYYSFFGHPAAYTPYLDQLLSQGCVFRNGTTMAVCRPALAAILSSQYPIENRIFNNDAAARLSPDDAMPRLLRDAGYGTFIGGKFWERTAGQIDPHAYGFDFLERVRGTPGNQFVRNGQDGFLMFLRYESFVRQSWFAQYSPSLPHLPTDQCPQRYRDVIDPLAIPIPAWIRESDRDAYRHDCHEYLANLAWVDDEIGKVLSVLEETSQLENTLIITMSDNGWGYGHIAKQSPFEKGVRTHISFTLPGVIAPAVREDLVNIVDIAPTILDFADIGIPASYSGLSLFEALANGSSVPRDYNFGNTYCFGDFAGYGFNARVCTFVRGRRFKYVRFEVPIVPENQSLLRWETRYATMPTYPAGTELLFDLQNDPFEQRNISNDPARQPVLSRFRREAANWIGQHRELNCIP